jgi:hypothetical protein
MASLIDFILMFFDGIGSTRRDQCIFTQGGPAAEAHQRASLSKAEISDLKRKEALNEN